MDVNVEGKEPGNWELYRGIERVEAAVHEISKNAVSAAVFAVEKQALSTRIDTNGKEIAELRASELANKTALENYAKEQEAQRGRNRLLVYGIVATPIIALLINFAFAGGFVRV
jgi:hypothetical protein